MEEQILSLLSSQDLTAAEIARRLECRRERVYQSLVHLEALGKVGVWIMRTHEAFRENRWQRCDA